MEVDFQNYKRHTKNTVFTKCLLWSKQKKNNVMTREEGKPPVKHVLLTEVYEEYQSSFLL